MSHFIVANACAFKKILLTLHQNFIGMENKGITLEDVNRFLEQFKVKASVFGIIYRVRGKNEESIC